MLHRKNVKYFHNSV